MNVRVELFTEATMEKLQNRINLFLIKLEAVKIIDIKFALEFDGTSYTNYNAMVIYNT